MLHRTHYQPDDLSAYQREIANMQNGLAQDAHHQHTLDSHLAAQREIHETYRASTVIPACDALAQNLVQQMHPRDEELTKLRIAYLIKHNLSVIANNQRKLSEFQSQLAEYERRYSINSLTAEINQLDSQIASMRMHLHNLKMQQTFDDLHHLTAHGDHHHHHHHHVSFHTINDYLRSNNINAITWELSDLDATYNRLATARNVMRTLQTNINRTNNENNDLHQAIKDLTLPIEYLNHSSYQLRLLIDSALADFKKLLNELSSLVKDDYVSDEYKKLNKLYYTRNIIDPAVCHITQKWSNLFSGFMKETDESKTQEQYTHLKEAANQVLHVIAIYKEKVTEAEHACAAIRSKQNQDQAQLHNIQTQLSYFTERNRVINALNKWYTRPESSMKQLYRRGCDLLKGIDHFKLDCEMDQHQPYDYARHTQLLSAAADVISRPDSVEAQHYLLQVANNDSIDGKPSKLKNGLGLALLLVSAAIGVVIALTFTGILPLISLPIVVPLLAASTIALVSGLSLLASGRRKGEDQAARRLATQATRAGRFFEAHHHEPEPSAPSLQQLDEPTPYAQTVY